VSVISITITPSIGQTIPGIPNTVSLSTSEPSTIFYTLDGCAPNSYSPVYIIPIQLPQSLLKVVLNILAVNGNNSSGVITVEYDAIVSEIVTMAGDRLSHAAVSDLGNSGSNNSLYPFGDKVPNPNFQYLNTADAGDTVYNQSESATSDGYDGSGNSAVFSNAPIDDFKFKQVYSTTNYLNEVFPGIGNLPAKTTIIGKPYSVEYTQERSSNADRIFNPRALVVYLDETTADPTNQPVIMRQSFNLEDSEIVRDGSLLMNSGMDVQSTTGGFIKSYYNPRTNMNTAYFYDNAVGRWIISTTVNQPTNNVSRLDTMVFGRDSSKYFKWFFALGRHLI
jgi:hypothetical protein